MDEATSTVAPLGGAYYRCPSLTLYTADATTALAAMPEASVDCLVTSPPYWRLRDYGSDAWSGGRYGCQHQTSAVAPTVHVGRFACQRCRAVRERTQLGLEPEADDYVAALCRVFSCARRVLTPRATMWINLGDSYSTNSDGYWCKVPGRGRQSTSARLPTFPTRTCSGCRGESPSPSSATAGSCATPSPGTSRALCPRPSVTA